MTKKQILKLRPEFKFGNMTTIDWFEITEGDIFFIIRSGLRHTDGETKSPFHYDRCIVGKNSKKNSLKEFKIWFNSLDCVKIKIKK